MPGRVQDKVALISGGASGIGLATGRLMVEEGAKVVLADVQTEAGERAAKELGSRATFIPLDVTREDQWVSAIDSTVKWHGRLDILVNNAGVGGGLKDI